MLQRMRGWVAPQPVLARSRPEAWEGVNEPTTPERAGFIHTS
jgi:hypothetical protein